MIEFLFQRIKNNLWLYLFLLLGAVLAVAIFSAIPMYSNGMLQRMLIKDLEIQQMETEVHSGQFSVSKKYLKMSTQDTIPLLESRVMKEVFALNQTPYDLETKSVYSNYFQLFTASGEMIHDHMNFASISDLENHVDMRSGRLPRVNDELVEVMMTDLAMGAYDMVLDGVYQVVFANKPVVTIQVVGIYTPSDTYDYYWGDGQLEAMGSVVTMTPATFESMDEGFEQFYITNILWKRFYDYTSIEIADVAQILENQLTHEKVIADLGDGVEMFYGLAGTLDSYAVRERILRITLWVLTVPVLIITCFYTYMISMLIIRNDENEIAMLKSRGAGTYQIFSLYLIQSSLMASIALIVGPWLGFMICKVIGASNGFLAFVHRSSLPIEVTGEVMLYALGAALVFMLFMLVPAFKACQTSIVQYKRKKNIDMSHTFWEKVFLDVIIILISAYGYYMFSTTGQLLTETGDIGAQMDPLLFLVPTLFVIGFGLLSVRLYPYLIRLIYLVGKRRWQPVMYYSLLNASRAERTSKFISIFIVLFLAFGLLNASQARTLNQNAIDQVNYEYVTDIQVTPYIPEREINEYWSSFIESFNIPTDNNVIIGDQVPYSKYVELEGIAQATKVMTNDDVFIQTSVVKIHDLNLMGIVPHEFAEMAWMRDGLLPYHFNNYMNIMTQYPTAIFLSADLAKEEKLRVGDTVELYWDKYSLTGVVYGFIEYFPGYNPYTGEDGQIEQMVFANYNYIETRLPVQKYEIWMNKEAGVKDQEILNNLAEAGLETERVVYRDQALAKKSNDPMLQGTNGVLTMSYVIILLITLVGYLIFWVLNVKGRALKFGIFRAMGMSMRQVTAIIVTEQLIMIVGALAAGLGIGTAASKIFVPLLQKFDVASAQIPPFRVVILQSDYWMILMITLAMLLTVLMILNNMVKRFKVNQVIKLGED